MVITVVPYTHDHQQAVLDVILPIQQHEFGVPVTIADQPDLRSIRDFYQTGAGGFWVAVKDDVVVGTIALKDIGAGAAALRKMFVAETARGAGGASSLLLDTLLAHAAQAEISIIYLGTTAKFFAAHRFYEKNGFTLIDEAALPASFPRMAVDTRFYRRAI